MHRHNQLPSLITPDRPLSKKVICFSTCRNGGFSDGPFTSFNLAKHVGDDQEVVEQNRTLLKRMLLNHGNLKHSDRDFVAPFKWMSQQHTTKIVDYRHLDDKSCDGVFTDKDFVPLVVMTADCMPIVFYCSKTLKIACIHAGWRGLMDGIIEQTLLQFQEYDALKVWIGPNISKQNFEVQADIIEQFKEFPTFITHSSHGYFVDLSKIAQAKLIAHGVSQIQSSKLCTYDSPLLYSHRKAKNSGDLTTGRFATVIMRIR